MGLSKIFIDRKYRLPRIWSNRELEKFAYLFEGDVVNVSGWQDADKEGKCYRDYFVKAKTYTLTNYKSEHRGFQGYENEIFLDLQKDLPLDLIDKFDVVFNHTVLEHIFEVNQAFKNLCLMSKDIVIIVVPFVQEMHTNYGDYWRFTPLTIKHLFEENGLKTLYLSFNSDKNASIYIFAIASKQEEKWKEKIYKEFSYSDPIKVKDGFDNYIGCHAIDNKWYAWSIRAKNILKKISKKANK